MIVPSGIEVHAHLDKALSSPRGAMPADLDAAVATWVAMTSQFDHDSFVERATRAIEAMVVSPADLVAIAGRNLSEAVADGSQLRTVLRQGRIVARTTTDQRLLC